MVINVYERCFRADAEFSGVRRNGALVMLTSDSEAGNIRYTAAVTFFPHNDDEDFAISYDAYFEKEMYSGRGRRSRKKEVDFLAQLRETIDGMAAERGASVLWEQPLTQERRA